MHEIWTSKKGQQFKKIYIRKSSIHRVVNLHNEWTYSKCSLINFSTYYVVYVRLVRLEIHVWWRNFNLCLTAYNVHTKCMKNTHFWKEREYFFLSEENACSFPHTYIRTYVTSNHFFWKRKKWHFHEKKSWTYACSNIVTYATKTCNSA